MKNMQAHRARTVVSSDFYVHQWLDDLARKRLPRWDVFVPAWVDPKALPKTRLAYYFVVPHERWATILFEGSAMTNAEVAAQRATLDDEENDPDADLDSLKQERAMLDRQVGRGLVTLDEQMAAGGCMFDGATLKAYGRFRAWTSNIVEVVGFADALNERGWTIVPVLPAYSYKDMVFPNDDRRYARAMVHAVTRVPCPWSPMTNKRQVYV